ncbi:neuronal acetylcholine receptor subunit alpha-3-like [Mobula birostris]|uniref:neuronal acetylcholine receptor subunit alpha-3-like n=1 Tax=Mobula birostris TaxID=1983395 RepID=UPI003B285307
MCATLCTPRAAWPFLLMLGGALALDGEKRLFAKLFGNYSRHSRPVKNVSEPVIVHFEVSLSQLIKVDEVNQIMETNLWLKHIWNDYRLTWDPAEYEGVRFIRVPSDRIWKPDIILYNNAVADFQVEEKTKVLLLSNGTVTWVPPAIFKSSCKMDVTYFPFDYQNCSMKFGSWTHDKAKIDLALIGSEMNQKDFWESGEWAIIAAPGYKHDIKYNCCEEIYVDITYSIYIRRMPLFHTINMIIPCLMISFLTVLVFWLPSDCGEKITLSVSVLLSLTVFLLGITESVPSTSLVIPLIEEYLLFIMIFVVLSIIITVFVLNVHYRSPSTHTMPSWVKTFFLRALPRLLFMTRPGEEAGAQEGPTPLSPPECTDELSNFSGTSEACSQGLRCTCCRGCRLGSLDMGIYLTRSTSVETPEASFTTPSPGPEVQEAVKSITRIVEQMKQQNEDKEIEDDWKYVALVIDRIFLWIFILMCILGSTGSFLQPLMSASET